MQVAMRLMRARRALRRASEETIFLLKDIFPDTLAAGSY
jgi:hypothetical protein